MARRPRRFDGRLYGWWPRIRQRATTGCFPDAPVELIRLDVEPPRRLAHEVDQVLISEAVADRRLREPSHVDVRLDRVDPLAHHQRLVYGGAESLHATSEVALELARMCPGPQAVSIDY